MIRSLCILFFLCYFGTCLCQKEQASYVEILRIECAGNKRTKSFVIEREMTFAQGAIIPADVLDSELKRSRESLLNTGLFSAVEISLTPIEGDKHKVIAFVTVRENWYLFPAPNLSLGDRSISEWLRDSKASIEHINLGLKFYHLNFTGRNDYLKVGFQRGLRDNYQFKYRFPYLGKKQQFQLTTSFDYTRSQEIAYATIGNEELILRSDDNTPYRNMSGSVQLTYRPALFSRHNLALSYNDCSVSDSVLMLNPSFFTDQNQSIRYFSLSYEFEGDYRDRRPVATEGYRIAFQVRKDGLGIHDYVNQATFSITYEQYFKVNEKLTAFLVPRARFHFTRNTNGYFFNDALRGDNSIRGYESYVIDGKDFIYAKTGLRWNVWNTLFDLGNTIPIDQINRIPFSVYVGMNLDAGMVYDPHFGDVNKFDSRMLLGYGPCVQFLIYEHLLFSVEYNFNIIQEGGIQLGTGMNF